MTGRGIINPQVWNFEPMPAPDVGIFDEPATCVIKINEAWVSFIIERLAILMQGEAWLGDTDEKFRASQQITKLVDLLASGGDCMFLRDVQILDNMLQKTFDGENWIDVGAVGISDINISTGAAGSSATSNMDGTTLNITIPRGDVGAEFAVDEPAINPDVDDDTRRCAVAVGLVTWLFEKYNDSIDQAEAAADTVSAMDSILALFPPAYLIADVVLDFANELVESGASLARAYDTVDRRENHQEWFYCNLQADGALSQAVWDAYFDYLFEEGSANPAVAVYEFYIDMFEFDAARARAAIESYGDGNCVAFSCGFDWEQDFIFDSSDQQGWVKFGGRPCTFGANGIEAGIFLAGSPSTARRAVTLYHNMPYRDATTQILNMLTGYTDSAAGDSSPGDQSFLNMRVLSAQNGTGTVVFDSGTLDIGSGSGEQVIDATHFVGANQSLLFYCQFALKNNSSTVTGSGNVVRYRIRGNGKNPFVA